MIDNLPKTEIIIHSYYEAKLETQNMVCFNAILKLC